ncbi:MAG: hypothetical protein AAF602_28860 [Myxococcota bacterium]
MRALVVVGILGLWPCVDPDPDPVDSMAFPLSACDLAMEFQACPECYSGEVECVFRDTAVTAGSCGDCQARGGLYAELCDAGVTAPAADIEAETTCTNLTNP